MIFTPLRYVPNVANRTTRWVEKRSHPAFCLISRKLPKINTIFCTPSMHTSIIEKTIRLYISSSAALYKLQR